MHKWKVIEDWLRKCTKCNKKQCYGWVTITLPRVRWMGLKLAPTMTGSHYKLKYPLIIVEFVNYRLFRIWKTIHE